jgi:hypothetical protein
VPAPSEPVSALPDIDSAITRDLADLASGRAPINAATVSALRKALWRAAAGSAVDELLLDLAWDLEFFVADPHKRDQDAAYYGSDKAQGLIAEALAAVNAAMTVAPNG